MSEFADWVRAFVMMAHDGTVYRPVLVDELGHLYALLQGMTPDDELRTVRLDDEGRMSAFVIDSTDAWGQMLAVGNAELAARLGSPVFYHQSGRVQLVENWEHGIARWDVAKSGIGASAALCTTSWETQGYSLKMVAGSTLNHYVYITAETGVLAAGRVGLALSFACSDVFESLLVYMLMSNGTTEWRASVLLDDVANTVEVQTGLAAWTSVGVLSLMAADVCRYNHLKFVIDTATGYYGNIYLNGKVTDASAEQCYSTFTVGGGEIDLEIKLIGNAAENDEVYVDNIILTTGEP